MPGARQTGGTVTEGPPRLVGHSKRQQAIVDALWVRFRTEPGAWVSTRELRAIGALVRGFDVNCARVKLRRMGWEIEGRGGVHAAYRLAKWAKEGG